MTQEQVTPAVRRGGSSNCATSLVCAIALSVPVPAWSQAGDELDDIAPITARPRPGAPGAQAPAPMRLEPAVQVQASPSSKGLFMAAFAPVAAQAVAQGLSALLAKLVDSFFTRPRPVDRAGAPVQTPSDDSLAFDPRPALPRARLASLATQEQTFGAGTQVAPGLAVRMLQLDDNDRPVAQLPVQGARVYTGQSLIIEFTSNVPGLVRAENISPAGKRTLLVSDTFVTSGSTQVLPAPGNVFYFKGSPGHEQFILTFTACRSLDAAERGTYARTASLSLTKEMAVRPSRGLQGGARLEDEDAERALTLPAVYRKLEPCGTKEMGVRPARVAMLGDGTSLFTDPKETRVDGTELMGGSIQALIEFDHVAR